MTIIIPSYKTRDFKRDLHRAQMTRAEFARYAQIPGRNSVYAWGQNDGAYPHWLPVMLALLIDNREQHETIERLRAEAADAG